jgi:hypothetical protein
LFLLSAWNKRDKKDCDEIDKKERKRKKMEIKKSSPLLYPIVSDACRPLDNRLSQCSITTVRSAPAGISS